MYWQAILFADVVKYCKAGWLQVLIGVCRVKGVSHSTVVPGANNVTALHCLPGRRGIKSTRRMTYHASVACINGISGIHQGCTQY